MEIEDFYTYLYNGAAAVVADKTEHVPMMFALLDSGGIAVIPTPGMTKSQMESFQEYLVQQPPIRAAALVFEAYGVRVQHPEELPRNTSIANHPGRFEAVVISILTHGRQAFIQCEIDRTNDTLAKAPFKWMNEKGGGPVGVGRFIRGSGLNGS
jgi:hypothetical protein